MQASLLAMIRAVDHLARPPDFALIDGTFAPSLACPTECLVKGDHLSLSIAAASIIAKVTRDRLMQRLALRFLGYGWEKNAGYGTAAHASALADLGITPHHRPTFGLVRQFVVG